MSLEVQQPAWPAGGTNCATKRLDRRRTGLNIRQRTGTPRMSKRKPKKSPKPAAAITNVAESAPTPEPVVSAADLAGSKREALEASQETETGPPKLLTQETETKLPPVPPPELEPEPPLPVHFAEPA